MKYLFFLLVLFGKQAAPAQSCNEVELFTTAQKRNLIQEYINICHQKHYFFDDKGIVKIISYQDTKGRNCWLVSALVDNRFLLSPPQQYSWLGNDLVLIYQGDSRGNLIPVKNPSSELRKCLSEVVGGRVYDYHPQPQYAYYTDENGVRKKILVHHDTLGNTHNDLILVFNLDGTVDKIIPA